MATVLLTGASGFLGKKILSELKGKFTTLTIGRTAVPDSDKHINVDFSDGQSISLPPVDYVVHCASKVHVVPRTEQEGQEFFTVNVEGTKRLLNGLQLQSLKGFVFISSVSVYGLDDGLNIAETHPLLSEEPYGKSKIICEELLHEHSKKYGFSLCILRLPLICGDHPVGNLKLMIEGIKKGKYFRIGAGEARKSMVMVDDIALKMQDFFTASGTYNLTDDYHPSFKEIEDLIASQINKKVKVFPMKLASLLASIGESINNLTGKRLVPLNKRALKKITKTLTFSDERAKAELGWKPSPVLKTLKIK